MKSHRYRLITKVPDVQVQQNEQPVAKTEYQKAIIEQETKISEMLNPASNKSHQGKMLEFDCFVKTQINEFEEKIAELIPHVEKEHEVSQPSKNQLNNIKDLHARSLAEAQLLSCFQIFIHQQQQICASAAPLIVEAYTLQKLKEMDPSEMNECQKTAELKLEQQSVSFTRSLYSKLSTTISPILKNFALSSEQKFIKVMQEAHISKELETQELCLSKQDYLEDLQRQNQGNKENLEVISSLQALNAKHPATKNSILKPSAYSDVIKFQESDVYTSSVKKQKTNDKEQLLQRIQSLRGRAAARKQFLLEQLKE